MMLLDQKEVVWGPHNGLQPSPLVHELWSKQIDPWLETPQATQ